MSTRGYEHWQRGGPPSGHMFEVYDGSRVIVSGDLTWREKGADVDTPHVCLELHDDVQKESCVAFAMLTPEAAIHVARALTELGEAALRKRDGK